MQKKEWNVRFENGICCEGKIWFADRKFNELYYYDIKQKHTEFVCDFPDEKMEERLFGALVKNHHFLYLIPFAADKMYKVNMKTYESVPIEIKKPDLQKYSAYLEKVKFSSAYSYKESIFLIGCSYPAIIEYNCVTDEMIYYDEWITEIEKYIHYSEAALFRKAEKVEKCLYIPFCRGNAVLIFNMETREFTVRKVGDESCRYASACYDGTDFWLLPRAAGAVVKWNETSNCYTEISLWDKQFEGNMLYAYGDIVCFQDKVFLIPLNAEQMFIIDKETNAVKKCSYSEKRMSVIESENEEDCIRIFVDAESGFLEMDTHMQTRMVEIDFPENMAVIHRKKLSIFNLMKAKETGNYCLVKEEYKNALEDFASDIGKLNEHDLEKRKKDISIGGKIYNIIMEI